MSKKRRRLQANAEAIKCRIDVGRLLPGGELPEGAIAADPTKQSPPSVGFRPLYYLDRPFTCKDCGKEEIWTAEQQKWYYEVARGSIYGQAIRCRVCRRKHRAQKGKAAPCDSPAMG
jgi:hypothetical protein